MSALEDRRLLAMTPLRLEVLTPLHAGSGDELVKGIHVESADGWTYAVDIDALCEGSARVGWDKVGGDGPRRPVGGRPLRDVQRYAVRARCAGPRASAGLDAARALRATASAAPTSPAPRSRARSAPRSSPRCAEREDASSGAAPRTPAAAGDKAERAAFACVAAAARTTCCASSTCPTSWSRPAAIEVVSVKVASMGEAGAWGWKRRGGPNAAPPDEPGVIEIFIEAVRPGTVLCVPLRIDAQRLASEDFSQWASCSRGAAARGARSRPSPARRRARALDAHPPARPGRRGHCVPRQRSETGPAPARPCSRWAGASAGAE